MEMVVREQIVNLLREIVTRKGTFPNSISDNSSLYQDGIGLDSMDTAELSINLELLFSRDPYSEGIFVRTLGELIAFYEGVDGNS